MAIYRQIHISFWQDNFVLSLTPEEKYFYLYLMTNSKTSQCGVYEIKFSVMILETGYNHETISKLISKFIKHGKIEYCKRTEEIFLINWLKYNSCRSPMVQKRVREEAKGIKSDDFRNKFYRLWRDYTKTVDTDLQPEPEPEPEPEPTSEPEHAIQKFEHPSKEKVINAFTLAGYPEEEAKKFFGNYSSKDWNDAKGRPIVYWSSLIEKWMLEAKNFGNNNWSKSKNEKEGITIAKVD